MHQSGDLNFQNGANSPQYCAILLNSLPTKVAEAIKTNNIDWSESSSSQMAHAVRYHWKDIRKQENQPVVKTKTEYVTTEAAPRSNLDLWNSPQTRARHDLPDWTKAPELHYPGYPDEPPPLEPISPRQHWRGNRVLGPDHRYNCGGLGNWNRECPTRGQNEGGGQRKEQREQRGTWQINQVEKTNTLLSN